MLSILVISYSVMGFKANLYRQNLDILVDSKCGVEVEWVTSWIFIYFFNR